MIDIALPKGRLGEKVYAMFASAGFDCCPELYNPDNHFESPYKAPELNSACHAWSCTPAFWLRHAVLRI